MRRFSMRKVRSLSFRTARLLLISSMLGLALDAIALGLMYQTLGLGMLAGVAYRLTRKTLRTTGAYGTARQAGLADMFAGGLQAESGLILGRVSGAAKPTMGEALKWLVSPRIPSSWATRMCLAALLGSKRGKGDFVRITDFTHLLTCSPSGGGKSVNSIIPNLLAYPGNCVVVDGKGELCLATARHRAEKFGHKIVILDPSNLCGPGADKFNPLSFLDPKRPDFIDRCRDLANQIVVRTGQETDPHFVESSENTVATFIAGVAGLEGNPEARTLYGMRSKLASREEYTYFIDLLRQQEGQNGMLGHVLAQLGSSQTWHVDRELGSVMSVTQRCTHVFGSPLIAASTSKTTFDPLELRRGKMTIYIVIPADRMVTWQGWLRVVLGSLIRIITEGTPSEANPVLFIVDECAHIGRMQVLEDAVTLMRGMGIRLWLFFQSLEQLKKCFGENAGTVLDNLATQQYFSINSYETAEAISKRIGDTTIVIQSYSGNTGTSAPTGGDGRSPGSRTSGRGTTTQETCMRLIRPEQVLTLGETAIVFHKNNFVILCDKIRHFSDPAFRQRGIIFRRHGTGRSRGHAVNGLLLSLAAAALTAAVTAVVIELPGLERPTAPAYQAGRDAGDWLGGAYPLYPVPVNER